MNVIQMPSSRKWNRKTEEREGGKRGGEKGRMLFSPFKVNKTSIAQKI